MNFSYLQAIRHVGLNGEGPGNKVESTAIQASVVPLAQYSDEENMADERNINLVMFDLAGTTVDDNVDGVPLVTVAMKDAFKKHGYDIHPETVNKYRGLEKKDAIRYIILDEVNGIHTSSAIDVEVVFKDFKYFLTKHLSLIKNEIPGTSDVFCKLKSAGVKIAVGSGFPNNVVESIVSTLQWKELVDCICSAEKVGHGRPHPAMIHSAMECLNISDPRRIVKVGDTRADVEEGKNAGCWTVAVLTGTQTVEYIKESNPDFIIDSVKDFPDLLSSGKFQC